MFFLTADKYINYKYRKQWFQMKKTGRGKYFYLVTFILTTFLFKVAIADFEIVNNDKSSTVKIK